MQIGINEVEMRDEIAIEVLRLFSIDAQDVKEMRAGLSPQHAIVAKFCYGLADAFIEERKNHKIIFPPQPKRKR